MAGDIGEKPFFSFSTSHTEPTGELFSVQHAFVIFMHSIIWKIHLRLKIDLYFSSLLGEEVKKLKTKKPRRRLKQTSNWMNAACHFCYWKLSCNMLVQVFKAFLIILSHVKMSCCSIKKPPGFFLFYSACLGCVHKSHHKWLMLLNELDVWLNVNMTHVIKQWMPQTLMIKSFP